MTTVSQLFLWFNTTMTKVPATKPTRVQRKRQEMRQRILTAAEQLMRNQPVDRVTIQAITEAADIGHGSFYLHFKSKYEVLIPLVEAHGAALDRQLQQHLAHLSDPAQVMAFTTRHMARMIAADPLWQWFLTHSGVPVDDMRNAIGRFGERDFVRGVEQGRFQVTDAEVTSSYAFGGFVVSLMQALKTQDYGPKIDEGVELMLRVFGLDPAEAKQIAHLPLADIEVS